jgi:hypothetical protein
VKNMMRETLEWAPFRTKPGVTDSQLLAASEHLQKEFVSRQEGFLSRRLVRAPGGGYVDIVLWSSLELARRAMENAARSDTCSAYFSLMEADAAEAGAGVLHFECLAEYAK